MIVEVELLTEILAKHDPMRLIKHGSPDDEYAPEAEAIAAKVWIGCGQNYVTQLVYDVFVEYFAPLPVGSKHDYHEVAKDVYDCIEASRI